MKKIIQISLLAGLFGVIGTAQAVITVNNKSKFPVRAYLATSKGGVAGCDGTDPGRATIGSIAVVDAEYVNLCAAGKNIPAGGSTTFAYDPAVKNYLVHITTTRPTTKVRRSGSEQDVTVHYGHWERGVYADGTVINYPMGR